MEAIVHFLEDVVHFAAQIGITLTELAGIAILLITVAKAIAGYFRKTEHLRLDLAEGIALALEFKLGGEVLRTVIVREWTELLILGAIIALRGALTLLIHWEISVEEKREKAMLEENHKD
ncbi:MAG: DUF1622 domain-containing protein [Oscillospiraceae bacterium]|nr:DUF1622 domain-containing protein [Oscillospiraceae bacterium]